MVCSIHGRELFYLHDLCCCRCIYNVTNNNTNNVNLNNLDQLKKKKNNN